jgi:hypothetical protein
MLLLAVLVPSAIYYVEVLTFFGQAPPLATLSAAVGLIILHLAFYLALTLALGTLFSGRGPVTGIGVGLVIAGLILGNALRPLAMVLPWPLSAIARGILQGQALPGGWPLPVVATGVWVVVLIGVALWRFSREEF